MGVGAVLFLGLIQKAERHMRTKKREKAKARASHWARNKTETRTSAIVSELNENGVSTWSNAQDDCYCVCHEDGNRECCWYCGGTREFVWNVPPATTTEASATVDTNDQNVKLLSLSTKKEKHKRKNKGSKSTQEKGKHAVTKRKKEKKAEKEIGQGDAENETRQGKKKRKHQKHDETEVDNNPKQQQKKRSRKCERSLSPSAADR